MYEVGKTRGQVTELGIEATINQACAAVVVHESIAVRGFVKLALQANYMENALSRWLRVEISRI